MDVLLTTSLYFCSSEHMGPRVQVTVSVKGMTSSCEHWLFLRGAVRAGIGLVQGDQGSRADCDRKRHHVQ